MQKVSAFVGWGAKWLAADLSSGQQLKCFAVSPCPLEWLAAKVSEWSLFSQDLLPVKCINIQLLYIYAKLGRWGCRIWDEDSDWTEIDDFWLGTCIALNTSLIQGCIERHCCCLVNSEWWTGKDDNFIIVDNVNINILTFESGEVAVVCVRR